MIVTILVILIVIGLALYGNLCNMSFITKNVCLKENNIVKKFNKLLKNIGKDDFSVIKEKLINTLDEYNIVKQQQFAENLTYLKEALASVNEQHEHMDNIVSSMRSKIHAQRDTLSLEAGARLVYELESYQQIVNRLNKAKSNLEDKIFTLKSKVVQFDGSLALRRAQIVSMIAESISIDNNSYIDLRLDSLEKEFKHEVTKIESEKEINSLQNKTQEQHQFDLEKYKKLFKEFK